MPVSKAFLHGWCVSRFQEQQMLLKELAAIPAPSHQEDLRAAYIQNWLIHAGAENVMVDAAKNVILPIGEGKAPFLVCMAHTDVVFPDTTPLPVREENGRICAPGVGDDTANVVALMLCVKFLLEYPDAVREPLLIVFNSCEEGLGNLKGVRTIMEDYKGRIRALVSFDCQSDAIVSRAVGSERWEVTVNTVGGHSFSDFGNPNAIALLSRFIGRLYDQKIPEKEDTITTFNVGLISGGTSVNTIAQSARMTYEYRSNDHECLAIMADSFRSLLETASVPGAEFTAVSIGKRPCGAEVPRDAQNTLLSRCATAIRWVYDIDVPLCAASTDANIPLSLGIPAATFGLYRGGGAHTREEYVLTDSLTPGLEIALAFFLQPEISNFSIDEKTFS